MAAPGAGDALRERIETLELRIVDDYGEAEHNAKRNRYDQESMG